MHLARAALHATIVLAGMPPWLAAYWLMVLATLLARMVDRDHSRMGFEP
jgi:hypothetical protein